MYYWHRKNIHVVLSDAEENEILFQMNTTPEERIDYRIESDTHKKFEKKIWAHLDNLFDRKKKEFEEYYLRSFVGSEAIQFFPIMLNAYGRVTRLAINGRHKTREEIEDYKLFQRRKLTEDLLFADEEIFYVSQINYSQLTKMFKVVSILSFPKNSIEKLVGTVDNFALLCKNFTLNFRRKSVDIKIK